MSRGAATLAGLVLAGISIAVACSDPRPPAEVAATDGVPSSAAVVFRDRARDYGLTFEHRNGMSGEFYIVEVIGPGGALFDYDDDGDLDLYLVQGTPLGPGRQGEAMAYGGDRLFRNDLAAEPGSKPRFTDVTEEAGLGAPGYGMGAVAGDYDNDGDPDLYVTRLGPNLLLRNDGDGSFTDVTAASGTDDLRWSVPAAFFDYDRDGWLDLYVGNYVDFRYSNHKQCLPEQGFVDYCSPLAYRPEPDRLFRNRGDGTFEDVTAPSGLRSAYGNTLGAVPADLDGDGLVDLYVANDWTENQMWVNRGDGTFEDRALMAGCAVNADGEPEASMGVVAADFDEDGDTDLFMTHLMGETNTVYRNDGGYFDDASIPSGLGTPSWDLTGFGTVALDYDNDGRLDIFVANGAVRLILSLVQRGDEYPLRQPDQLFRNLGEGRFEEVGETALEPLLDVGRGTAAGDVDNDGDTDLIVMNNNGPVRLLENVSGAARSWIGLRLLESSGRDALGAVVRLRDRDGRSITRRAQTAGSYASSSDPRILIGLGDDVLPQDVSVTWPDGSTESFTALPVRSYSVLRQGDGSAPTGGPR